MHQPHPEAALVKILHSLLTLIERILTLPIRLVRAIIPGGRRRP